MRIFEERKKKGNRKTEKERLLEDLKNFLFGKNSKKEKRMRNFEKLANSIERAILTEVDKLKMMEKGERERKDSNEKLSSKKPDERLVKNSKKEENSKNPMMPVKSSV